MNRFIMAAGLMLLLFSGNTQAEAHFRFLPDNHPKAKLQLLPPSRTLKKDKPVIMISSTVYGLEPLLDELYDELTELGYTVWMSHKGTLPVDSNLTAFQNCLKAVEDCDYFFCIITPQYGSGVTADGLSITHLELQQAIKHKKTRWVIAHDHVVFSRILLRNLGYPDTESRAKLTLERNAVFGNLKVIDMYEEAIRDGLPLKNRRGNWVQKYSTFPEVVLYAKSQFSQLKNSLEKKKTH
jgi:hypothetical protein